MRSIEVLYKGFPIKDLLFIGVYEDLEEPGQIRYIRKGAPRIYNVREMRILSD